MGWSEGKTLSELDGVMLRKCIVWALGGMGGWRSGQGCRNHGCWLIKIVTPELKE